MSKRKIIFFCIPLLGIIFLAVYSFWKEPASLRVQNYDVKIIDLPESLQNLRVVIMSDLHIGSPFNGIKKLKSIVEHANEANADLILLPGDFVIQGVIGGEFVDPEKIGKELALLKARLGVWAVLGNHDWWLNGERVKKALEENNIPVLDDAATLIKSPNGNFWLMGISDYWEGAHDIRKALAQVKNAAPILAFTHNPDVFPDVPERISLTIAGHTHGGQVYLPFLGRLVVPSRYKQRYAAGHIIENEKHLFTSTGLGTSIIPVRFLVPPEITVLELIRGEE